MSQNRVKNLIEIKVEDLNEIKVENLNEIKDVALV
jgi:hypothetical protein